MGKEEGSVLSGMLWIIVLGILLFWLPVLGQMIAGFVGGKKAGSAMNGLLAAILPAIIIGLVTFVLLGWVPVIGAIVAGAVTIVVMASMIVVIIFAIIGGAMA